MLPERAWDHIAVPQENPYVPEHGVIIGIEELAPGERLFKIRPVNGQQLRHGEYVLLMGENAEEAPFSICSEPDAHDDTGPYFECAIRRIIPPEGIPEGALHTLMNVSGSLHSRSVGDAVYYSGPYGGELPIENYYGYDVIFIVGGIGLYPARRPLLAIAREPERYGTVSLLFGTKHPSMRYFGKQLDAWHASQVFNVLETIDAPTLGWTGHVGFVHTLLPLVPLGDPAKTVVYIVGPSLMFKPTVAALRPLHIPTSQIYLALERQMRCGRRHHCGHCKVNGMLICEDEHGPVYTLSAIDARLWEAL